MCFVQFPFNYMWNLLAISEWKLFKSKCLAEFLSLYIYYDSKFYLKHLDFSVAVLFRQNNIHLYCLPMLI